MLYQTTFVLTKMDFYIDDMTQIAVQAGTIGLIVGAYLMVYLSFRDSSVEIEANRVIRTMSSILEGHMQNLKVEKKFDNPYDLFAYIYPSLRDMDNAHIDELVTLIDTYNKNWINDSN